ncbi:MAG TPA: glycosyltransferase family A protein [Candidatus Nitrosotalea sp.]|nr:glycosyltransferase family A protein [Candidatus Nitrosotalea sp.]
MKETYYCFFPVRDGQDSIAQVMDSLINQTAPPAKIIVVDDGSSDDTPKILSEYEKKYGSLVKVIHTGSTTRDYRRIPKLWNLCLERGYDYHMIGAGDCIFEREYAEKLLKELEKKPNLAICSGDYGTRKSLAPHGAGRFVRQSFFFKNYEKYPEIIGYESEILFRCIIQKHDMEIFNDVRFEHVDKLGHGHNFDEFGQGMKALGYHPLYVLARCALEFMRNGEIGRKGALNILYKFLVFRPDPKGGYYSYFPDDIRLEIRRFQWNKIKKFASNPKKIAALLK